MAFSSIIITELARFNVPPLAVAFYRIALAAALLWPAAVAFRWNEIATLARSDLGLLLLGGLCLAIHFGAWISSLQYIPIATSVVLVGSHPFFVVIAAHLILGERQGRRNLAGIATGLLGTGIIFWDGLRGLELEIVGDTLALIGSLATVGYFIVGRKMRKRISLLAYVTPLYTICSLILLAWAALAGSRLIPYSGYEWFLFAALAVVPTIFGHTIFNWALRHVGASSVAMAFLGEPIVASVLAFVFFRQIPKLSVFIGGIFVLLGIYLSSFGSVTSEPVMTAE